MIQFLQVCTMFTMSYMGFIVNFSFPVMTENFRLYLTSSSGDVKSIPFMVCLHRKPSLHNVILLFCTIWRPWYHQRNIKENCPLISPRSRVGAIFTHIFIFTQYFPQSKSSFFKSFRK